MMKEKGKAIASPSLHLIETEEKFRNKNSNFYPGDIEKTAVPSTSLLIIYTDTARHVVSHMREVDPGEAESLKGFLFVGNVLDLLMPKLLKAQSVISLME